MKTNTGQKILEFIKERGQTPPKEIINFIGFSAPAVFRQLKKLRERGLIHKSGGPPRVFYHLPMTEKERLTQQVVGWVTDPEVDITSNHDFYCPARDIFQFRNERIIKTLIDSGVEESLSYLLVAITGEIGNNSFDHNFGRWPNIPGVYFKTDLVEKIILLADRGQGVLTTLKRARPNIKNDEEALRVAFTETVSGRYPEQRGNGLKFVKNVVVENNLELFFCSGTGRCGIDNKEIVFRTTEKNIPGAIAIIKF